MGNVPGTNSCPVADVVTLVPSQAAACDIISPAFFEPVSVVLLLETAVIALFWVMIQLVAFLTPLLATVLLLIEHINQCLPK